MGSPSCAMTLFAHQSKHRTNHFKDRVVLQFWPQSQGNAEEWSNEMIPKWCHILPRSPQSSFVPTDRNQECSSTECNPLLTQHKSMTQNSEPHFNTSLVPHF